jgi:hypothetical protein
MANIFNYIKHSWTAFRSQDAPDINQGPAYGPPASSTNPIHQPISYGNERSMINSLYNKIAVDVSMVTFYHQKEEEKDGLKYNIPVKDKLTNLLKIEANIDQTGPELIQSLVFKMLDEGCAALVPTKTTSNPIDSEAYTTAESRIGTVERWRENDVVIKTFNPHAQRYMSILLPKKIVPIIENPFYAIMNEPNSLYQRLVRTLKTIDKLNDQNSSGKLDLIIQLPYASRSSAKKNQAEERRNEIEEQLSGSQLGIAYIDVSEKVIQLNRSVENNLWEQAKTLMDDLFGQLGMSPAIFNGTANEQELFNYYSRTLKPICSRIALNIERKWLSETARSQGHSIAFYQDPFELLPTTQLADTIDKFIKDTVLSSNEGRILIGREPTDKPEANSLTNPFTSSGKEQPTAAISEEETNEEI